MKMTALVSAIAFAALSVACGGSTPEAEAPEAAAVEETPATEAAPVEGEAAAAEGEAAPAEGEAAPAEEAAPAAEGEEAAQ